jgi:hypothetical protein
MASGSFSVLTREPYVHFPAGLPGFLFENPPDHILVTVAPTRMKRTIKHKIKKWISVFTMTIIGIVMTWTGISMLIENNNRDLENVEQQSGIIESIKIISQKKKVGAYPFSTLVNTDFFAIKLKNTDLKFGTHNPKEDYQDLLQNLNSGDFVKRYYFPTSNYTNNIYQLEKNGRILVLHSDFKKNHIIAGTVILVFGFAMFLFIFLFIKRYDTFAR